MPNFPTPQDRRINISIMLRYQNKAALAGCVNIEEYLDKLEQELDKQKIQIANYEQKIIPDLYMQIEDLKAKYKKK